jgi:hypothetical protein
VRVFKLTHYPGGQSLDTGADEDSAIDVGHNSGSLFEGAFAGNGDLDGGSGTGSGDTAIDIGNNSSLVRGSEAYDGNDNYAGVSGDDSLAATGDGGNNNVADVVGPHSFASAGEGNDNVGYVFDPSGTDGSTALAGFPGDSDLSAVFGDGLYSDYATGGNFLYDISSPIGDLPGSAAATSGGFLAELLSLF